MGVFEIEYIDDNIAPEETFSITEDDERPMADVLDNVTVDSNNNSSSTCKSYVCDQCSKSYTNIKSYKRPMVLHTGRGHQSPDVSKFLFKI